MEWFLGTGADVGADKLFKKIKADLLKDDNSNASCIDQIFHGQTTHLMHGNERFEHRGLENYLKAFKADIWVLNTGAWIQDDGDQWTILDQVVKVIEKYKRNTLLI